MSLNDTLKIKDWIIHIRRHIHQYPELGYQEYKTSNFIKKKLGELKIPFRETAKTGITADIKRTGKKRIALRADMDALPIQEENKVSYKSKYSGKMHACGHDAHIAMLLGAAKILRGINRGPDVRLLFQPSEERLPGGAPLMIQDRALKDVDEIYGIHVDPDIPLGIIRLKDGIMMASADEMDIKIIGRGGHASSPNKAIDPIYISSVFINSVQSIISRLSSPLSPVVITISAINGGNIYNVIPEIVEMKGTVRAIDDNTHKMVIKKIKKLLKYITGMYGAKYELNYRTGYPRLVNSKEGVEKFKREARDFLKINLMKNPIMGGEDFAWYLKKCEGAFAFIGVRNEKKGIIYPLHHSKFNIDEDVLPYGAYLLAKLAS